MYASFAAIIIIISIISLVVVVRKVADRVHFSFTANRTAFM